jgi:hypothetical protein
LIVRNKDGSVKTGVDMISAIGEMNAQKLYKDMALVGDDGTVADVALGTDGHIGRNSLDRSGRKDISRNTVAGQNDKGQLKESFQKDVLEGILGLNEEMSESFMEFLNAYGEGIGYATLGAGSVMWAGKKLRSKNQSAERQPANPKNTAVTTKATIAQSSGDITSSLTEARENIEASRNNISNYNTQIEQNQQNKEKLEKKLKNAPETQRGSIQNQIDEIDTKNADLNEKIDVDDSLEYFDISNKLSRHYIIFS